ncbi:transmembrane protein 33-like [Corticium candelabrum]|uniref:transmembrane protein 33-like n=1 Tax=Corticium candelabrum TaxID=121492 RepID=UPI002E25C994|nr:transmembrane protein 33-like [Corticium candelabrum]
MADKSSSSSTESSSRPGLINHLMSDKKSTILCVLRVLTLFYSALYSLPFIGSPAAFYRCLVVYVGVSYLRATQRLPRLQFSRVYLQQVLLEDSIHYLLYSFTFLNSFPLSCKSNY